MTWIARLANFGAGHRRRECDGPNWHRSPECRDTDAVSGFTKTTPVFSTDARTDPIEEP